VADLFELKQAEKELRASEKKYKELAELLPQLVYEVDGSGLVTFLNAAGSEMTGYSREDLAKGLNIRDVFHPDDLDGLLRDFGSALRGEAPQGREYKIITKDGGTILMVMYSTPVWNDGTIVGLRGVAIDISERKKAEETIRQQSEFLRTVVESLTYPFYVVNIADYTVSMANSAARRLTSSGETTCYALKPGQNEPCNTPEKPCPVEEVKATKRPATVEHLHYDKDGTARYEEVHAYPLFDSQGNVSQAIEYTLDISDRKRAEQALKSSEQRFRTLTESSPIGITIIQRGKRQYANPAVVSMFGYERTEDVLRLEVQDLYDSETGEMIKDLIETELEGIPAPYFQEATGLKRSGEAFDISMWMVKTEFEGEPAILTFVLDVSEEKSLRSQLFHAQKMESLGTMAGGIAHDFNNLLTIIQGYSDLLLASKTQRDPDYEDLRKILSTAEKGADLVRRILTFSRKVESNRRPMDLNDEVRQSTKLLERTIPKMIAIELHLADDLKRINADPGQIEQVLLNLAVNAQGAMPEGGTLTLETENITLDEEYCRTHLESEPGEYVMLSVSDTGYGIGKDIQEHIFEPFYTTKEAGEGTGLGLAVVYGIITGHEGRILCYSEPGHGTTFKIYLPAIGKETTLPEAAPDEMIRGGTESILLVDDEEGIRTLGARILSQAGYEVLTAETGQKALEVYRSKKEGISLVVLDLVMPQMGGKECLQELLKIDPEAKVIIASGFSRNGVTNASVEAGAREFVGKPYKVTQLLQTVRKVLDGG
jgi:two-component system cell cycle sensor histidine kinase/response regulator CckA